MPIAKGDPPFFSRVSAVAARRPRRHAQGATRAEGRNQDFEALVFWKRIGAADDPAAAIASQEAIRWRPTSESYAPSERNASKRSADAEVAFKKAIEPTVASERI